MSKDISESNLVILKRLFCTKIVLGKKIELMAPKVRFITLSQYCNNEVYFIIYLMFKV